MKAKGLELSAEQIFSLSQPSLKDAIIQFGGGCTGEVISSQGLVLTNHHCGLGQIQEHSSVDHDYLSDGFWAYTQSEELVNPGLTVKFLINVTDVTQQLNDSLSLAENENERSVIFSRLQKILTKEATKDTHYKAQIKSFFKGNEYYLFVYEEFQDVRLVGAPPWGIGKYGADTDNWMWPRHKGDFCLFRVYTAPDGSPAPYAKENIPLKPKHYLPVATSGVKEGDFTMILGYPGRTNRYLSSYGVKLLLEQTAPATIKIRTKKLDIYRADMDADDEVRIKYASKQASTANYWKYYIGQEKQLRHNKVIDKKVALENEFRQWVNADPSRKQAYDSTLVLLEKGYSDLGHYNLADKYFFEAIYQGSELFSFVYSLDRMYNQAKAKPDAEAINKRIDSHFKDYNAPTDRKVLAAMLDLYYKDVDQEFHPGLLKKIERKYKGNFTAYTNYLFRKSILVDKDRLKEAIATGKSFRKDPAFKLVNAFIGNYLKRRSLVSSINQQIDFAERTFIRGLQEMQPDRNFYPDANFTMRITYGNVGGYKPADAIDYDYYTRLSGVMEKEIPGNWEFDVPDKLNLLYDEKDFGPYANAKNELAVNFITNTDITGGNSGSPVIDAKGRLIGLAFDGNWEAMSGDIQFEPNLQRTICVDIRYVLFVIDKYAGAQNLIHELTLVE